MFCGLIFMVSCIGQAEELPKDEPKNPGGPFVIASDCEYNEFTGNALILGSQWLTETSLELTFNFLPADDQQVNQYKFPNFKNENQTRIVYFDKPPNQETKDLVIQQNILGCSRLEIKKGTCTPVVFKFPFLEK